MVDVGWNDSSPPSHFSTNELWCYQFGNCGAPGVSRVLSFVLIFDTLVLSNGNEFHFGRNNSFSRIVHLRNVPSGMRAPGLVKMTETESVQFGVSQSQAAVV